VTFLYQLIYVFQGLGLLRHYSFYIVFFLAYCFRFVCLVFYCRICTLLVLYLCLCARFVIGIGALSLNVNKYPLNLIDIKKHDMVSAHGTNGKCIKVKFTLE
jgi:hypothetical protein